MGLRLLHTSDWHLGHTIYRKRRDEEFAAFLEWLCEVIDAKQIEVLIIAGDIFDTAMPSNAAQKMYYDFLGKIAASSCRHIVITAGNHDSPSFLAAPQELLSNFRIHIREAAHENIEDEILLLRDENGKPELIIAAVPYLRERDVREFAPGEDFSQRTHKLVEGIRAHYWAAAQVCKRYREEHGQIPAVGTGHIYAAGASLESDNEKELYIGTLYRADVEIFPEDFDYVALGHIHKAQIVGENRTRRYSGSPLPMSFAESRHEKSVTVVDLERGNVEITEIPIPKFQDMRIIRGNRKEILAQIGELASLENSQKIWLEIQHDGTDSVSDLNKMVRKKAEGTNLEILCVLSSFMDPEIGPIAEPKSLASYTPEDIFRLCLESEFKDKKALSMEEKEELMGTFRELCELYQESLRSGE